MWPECTKPTSAAFTFFFIFKFSSLSKYFIPSWRVAWPYYKPLLYAESLPHAQLRKYQLCYVQNQSTWCSNTHRRTKQLFSNNEALEKVLYSAITIFWSRWRWWSEGDFETIYWKWSGTMWLDIRIITFLSRQGCTRWCPFGPQCVWQTSCSVSWWQWRASVVWRLMTPQVIQFRFLYWFLYILWCLFGRVDSVGLGDSVGLVYELGKLIFMSIGVFSMGDNHSLFEE